MKTEVLRYEGAGPVDLLFAHNAASDIAMGEWTRSDEMLYSLGASTCIILAAHNEETERGLMGHFSCISDGPDVPYSNQASFNEALAAIPDLGDPLMSSVFLGGGKPCVLDDEDTVEADRVYAERAVMDVAQRIKLPGDQVVVEWSEADRAIDVELDCATGILVVHNASDHAIGVTFAQAC